MANLTSIFDSIEKLAYDILIWILLVPKSLVKIVIDPGWVPRYVSKELKQKDENRFDDFLSPVILILIASLMPYLYQLVTPYPEASIDSGTKVEQDYGEVEVGWTADFWVDSDFIADTGNYSYEWDVDGGEIYYSGDDYISVYWDESGYHTVSVTVTNDKGEELWDWFDIYVVPEGDSPLSSSGGEERKSTGQGDLLNTLQGTQMVLPALIFLGLPMLFAIATEAFRGHALMRSTLKRSFYIQCYYFSPVILVMWSLYLGFNFFIAPDEVLLGLIVMLVAVIMLLWLIRNETRLIRSEREMKSGFLAFVIVMACLFLFGGVAISAFLYLSDSEVLRRFLGLAYVLATFMVLLAWFLYRRRRKKLEE